MGSKIPRSFITPTSKLPALITSSTPIEPPKFILPSAKKVTPSIKNTPLHEIKTDKFNIQSCENSFNLKNNEHTKLKRNAPTAGQHLPKKQIKITPKVVNGCAKIAPYDYKARYNDLADKHKTIKCEYTELKEKFEECTDELDAVKSSLESVSGQSTIISNMLEVLKADHDKLRNQYEELNTNYTLEKKTGAEVTIKVQDLNQRVIQLNNDLSDISSQLSQSKTQLALKNAEYDSLKTTFEKEVQKCSQLSSICEENQVKMLSYTSELTFLNTRQKIIDQKNEENLIIIANMRQESEDLKIKLSKMTENLENVQIKLDDKTIECDNFSTAYNLEAQKYSQLNSVLLQKNEIIASYENNLREMNNCKELLQVERIKDGQAIDSLRSQNIELQKTIECMHENQKRLRNEIQDLKGHIRVFCRIRPPLSAESGKQLLNVEILDSCTMEIDKSVFNSVSGMLKKQKHNFTFDGIFTPHSTQCEVFAEVSNLIQSALDGYNVCIFAYGQTGSGKTYTMEGASDSLHMGIIPRVIEMIFTSIPNLKKIGWEFKITASFLEIYNENIYDLLDSNKDQEEHSIKMADSKGTDVYVSNLKEESVNSSAELLKLLMVSQKNRQTAATMCNERSSRSHSVSKIRITAFHEQRKEKYVSNLNLVDLAGSESAKTSQRLDETKCINKSLSELSKVILALQSKQSHIPYRNSKLTYLLMPSLGGNSKTLMLVNIAQLDDCYQETVNSLRFAAKVNSCRIGNTKKNITTC